MSENEMLEQVSEEAEVEKEEIVLDLLNPMVIKLESQNELHSKAVSYTHLTLPTILLV